MQDHGTGLRRPQDPPRDDLALRVEVVDDHAAVGEKAAREVLGSLPTPAAPFVLGVATGSTPLPVYRRLAAARGEGADFSSTHLVALDEYVGLPPGHPASFGVYVHSEIAVPLGVAPEHVVVPTGSGAELERRILELGGVDLQLLGIGRNGHLAFNEPPSALDSRSRIVALTDTTRRDNAAQFGSGDDVPSHALTQGLGTILEARHLVLLAVGGAKADAVRAALIGPVSPECPASAVQLHPHVTVILDRSAARLLSPRDLSRFWQA